jgi:hypothetical protein
MKSENELCASWRGFWKKESKFSPENKGKGKKKLSSAHSYSAILQVVKKYQDFKSFLYVL